MATRCSCPPESCAGSARAEPAQADRRQQRLHARRVRPAQQAQRQFDVLGHAQVRQHVEGLEDEAHVLPAQPGARVVVERRQRPRRRCARGRGRRVQPGDAVQQRRLADTRFAEQRDELAALQAQRDIVEHRRVAEGFGQALDLQHRRRSCLAASGGVQAPASTPQSRRGHRRARRCAACRAARSAGAWRAGAWRRCRPRAGRQLAASSAAQAWR
jgi:hypothetical protein